MRVLILQHHPDEGPGTLGEYLTGRGAKLAVVQAWDGQEVPAEPGDWAGIISMGGPLNVYEEAEHPWLAPEGALLAKAARAKLPLLGVCLGAQLIAKALGAQVARSPEPEEGWHQLRLTPEAEGDALFAGLEPAFPVVQLHGDMFQVPAGGRLLATGEPCPHQAFVWGRAYGLQFHLEVTPAMLEAWFPEPGPGRRALEEWDRHAPAMEAAARRMYDNFWSLLRSA
jgi:GMP synthase-like glutamine amidotransferase